MSMEHLPGMSSAALASPIATSPHLARGLVVASLVATLHPAVPAGAALIVGIAIALSVGNPWPEQTRAIAKRLLAWCVVGLGAGMNLSLVMNVGAKGAGFAALTIGSALVLGTALGRALGVRRDTSLLVTVGTAICGGSAIAAVAPTIRAKDDEVSVALVTVFLLNAVALFVFPVIGRHFHLSQDAFGLWCAVAIHDTSSVVGAAAQYGDRALEVATAGKLARALWIVPVGVSIGFLRARTDGTNVATKAPKPWFIAGFVAVAALVTFVPALRGAGHAVSAISHRLLAVTLCLTGLGLSRKALRALGIRPLVQAATLWVVLASTTLLVIIKLVLERFSEGSIDPSKNLSGKRRSRLRGSGRMPRGNG